MNDSSTDPQTPLSIEDGVKTLFADACQGIKRRREDCEDRIRRSPVQSVLGAAAIGYFLHRMPMRAILVANVRVLSALTPPALLLFGTAKLYEYFQHRNAAKAASDEGSPELFELP